MRAAGRRGLPRNTGARAEPIHCGVGSEMSVLRGDTRDPAERLALEMQKAAEERPLIGERKGPYAIGENTIGSHLVPEPAQR